MVKASLHEWPEKTPSVFLITDAVLMMDKHLGFKLIVPPEGQTKTEVALVEAGKLKKCLMYLRYLLRNSEKSKFSEITELKSMIRRRSRESLVTVEASDEETHRDRTMRCNLDPCL